MAEQLILISGLPSTRITREASYQTESGGWISVRSTILVCPACRKDWAHLIFTDDPAGWHPCVIGAYCESHQPPADQEFFDAMGPVPGSLFPSGWSLDYSLLNALPRELLAREISLYFKYTERDS